MESLYDDDIDILGNGDALDGQSERKGPNPLLPSFYVATAEPTKDSASHLALQKAYSDLKHRYNGLAQKFRDRSPRLPLREVEVSAMSRETNLDDIFQMPSMAQAAGAEMPDTSSEQFRAQMGYNTYLQRQLMQETTKLNRLQLENKSLKDKIIDVEGKYKVCLREKDQMQQDLEILSDKNKVGAEQETEVLQSRDKLIEELKKESYRLHADLIQTKQGLSERDKLISELSAKFQLADRQVKENERSNSQELIHTRMLLSERENEISQLKKQCSRLSSELESKSQSNVSEQLFGNNSRETQGNGRSVENASVLEDVSLQQINQNEQIIRNLQQETKQQASIITKLFDQVSGEASIICI